MQMRTLTATLFAAVTVATVPEALHAQTSSAALNYVSGRQWFCQRSDSDEGAVDTVMVVKFDIAGDNSMTGELVEGANLEGVAYQYHAILTGYAIDSDGTGVYAESVTMDTSDSLPAGDYWAPPSTGRWDIITTNWSGEPYRLVGSTSGSSNSVGWDCKEQG